MDPLNAPLLIVWAVAALISVLSIGGCVPQGPGPVTYYPQPVYYGAPPAAPAMPAYYNRAPSVTCVRTGNFTFC